MTFLLLNVAVALFIYAWYDLWRGVLLDEAHEDLERLRDDIRRIAKEQKWIQASLPAVLGGLKDAEKMIGEMTFFRASLLVLLSRILPPLRRRARRSNEKPEFSDPQLTKYWPEIERRLKEIAKTYMINGSVCLSVIRFILYVKSLLPDHQRSRGKTFYETGSEIHIADSTLNHIGPFLSPPKNSRLHQTAMAG